MRFVAVLSHCLLVGASTSGRPGAVPLCVLFLGGPIRAGVCLFCASVCLSARKPAEEGWGHPLFFRFFLLAIHARKLVCRMAYLLLRAETETGSRRAVCFRNAGELRASLRSIAAYAPWVRHVYLIVAGQTQIPGRKGRGDTRARARPVRACVRASVRSTTPARGGRVQRGSTRTPRL